MKNKENFSEKDMKEVTDKLFKGMSVEKLDGDITMEDVRKIASELFRNELIVTQWENNIGGVSVAYTVNTGAGNLTTGLMGLKGIIDGGVIFTHVIFNGNELDEETTEEFWEQYKSMVDEELSKD